jgi:DNA-binding MarR family transcriptional regulator
MTSVKAAAADLELTPVQQKIVAILQNDGPQEPANLGARLHIKHTDLERNLATLRHMQKIRGELIGGKKLIRLW